MNKLIFLLRACSRLACRNPRLTWVWAAGLACLAVILIAGRLELKTSNLDLVDPEVPEIARFLSFSRAFGTPNVLMVVLQGEDPDALKIAANEIAPRLAALPEIRNVLYRVPLDPEWLDETGLEEFIMSRDGRALYFYVQPRDERSNASEIEHMIRGVRGVLNQADLPARRIHAGLTGIPEYAIDDKTFIQQDIKRLSLFALAGILAVFMIGFRSWREPAVAGATLLMACIYTLAAACFIPGHLTLLSASFVSILFGLGIDFGIHVIRRIEERLGDGRQLEQAVEEGLHFMYRGLLTGALTTALVFFGMTFSGLRGFAELGLIAGTGVLLCFLCMITLLPAGLLLIGPRKQPRSENPSPGLLSKRFSAGIALVISLPLMLALFTPGPDFNSNYLDLQPKHSEAVKLERAMVENSDYAPQFAAFAFETEAEAERFADRLLDEPLVGEVRTLAGLGRLGLPEDQEVKLREVFASQFTSDTGTFAVYAYPAENVWIPEVQSAFVSRMKQLHPQATGMPVIGQYMLDQSRSALQRVTWIALAVLAVCLVVDFRSGRLAFAAMLPTLMTFMVMRLWMEWMHMPYNPINIMALPVILGIAVDDGVHVVHRFIQENGDITRTLRGTGRSVLLTSMTSMISFGALAFGAHRGLASFGLLLFLGVASALVISLGWLPWLLQRFAGFWLEGQGAGLESHDAFPQVRGPDAQPGKSVFSDA